MNSNMTASGPSCCPQIITNAVNMYFLIILTDRYDLEMFGPKYGQNLWNINIYANLLFFLRCDTTEELNTVTLCW